MKSKKIGFIGQGFVGGNLADNFNDRGFKEIVRYDLSKYKENREKIRECEVVFIAVPTPTVLPDGFNDSILVEVLKLLADGAIAVIKSTIMPGTCNKLSGLYPRLVIMHNPEFLNESSAREDTDYPDRQILGIKDLFDADLKEKARMVLKMLPKAKFEQITGYKETALVKYGGNCFFLVKNVYFNILKDITEKLGADWSTVINLITEDPRIHTVHTRIYDKDGRGAGGHCLPKDYVVFRQIYEDNVKESRGLAFLLGAELKNASYLKASGKDENILNGIYGLEERQN